VFIFKSISESDVSITETIVHKTQNLHSGSSGVISVQYRSGSKKTESDVEYTVSGSYWNSLHLLFYQSGSKHRTQEASKYADSMATLGINKLFNPQHLEKFYVSGSVISVPQKYFGERIKAKTFKLVDNSTSKEVTIKDDGFGNLYATGNSDSQSTSSPSSSANYVGNIFYDYGIITLTDTGSYSSSINYVDVSTDDYTFSFDSTQTIYTHEYIVTIEPREYNYTMNATAKGFLSGSDLYGGIHSKTPYLSPNITGSEWSPYITSIHLYSNNEQVLNVRDVDNPVRGLRKLYEPVVIAHLPRPIKVRNDMVMSFKLRLDI